MKKNLKIWMRAMLNDYCDIFRDNQRTLVLLFLKKSNLIQFVFELTCTKVHHCMEFLVANRSFIMISCLSIGMKVSSIISVDSLYAFAKFCSTLRLTNNPFYSDSLISEGRMLFFVKEVSPPLH